MGKLNLRLIRCMARVKITPTLAPTPRLTLWVPFIVAGVLSGLLLTVLLVFQR